MNNQVSIFSTWKIPDSAKSVQLYNYDKDGKRIRSVADVKPGTFKVELTDGNIILTDKAGVGKLMEKHISGEEVNVDILEEN